MNVLNKNDKGSLKWIFENSKKQIPSVVILGILYSVMAVTGVVASIYSKDIIDYATGGNLNGIIYSAIILVALVVFQIVANVVSKVFVFNINAKLEIFMKTKLFSHMTKKNYADINAYHSGELLNRLTSDIVVVTSTITTLIPQIAFLVVKLIGVFLVLFSIDYMFTLILFAGGFLFLLFSQVFKKKMKTYHKEAQETDGKVRSFLQETLSSLLVVKVFRAEKIVKNNAVKLQMDNFNVKRKRNYVSIFASTGFSLIFTIAYFYGMIWGAVSIYTGLITFGTLTAVLSLVSQIQGPISGLTGVVPQYFGMLASAERIMEIENLDDEPMINSSHIDVNKVYENMESIEFSNISFSFDSEEIFNNANLSIKKGDFAVISGISGIGKSTLTRLLLSVFSLDSGEIYLKEKDNSKVIADKYLRKIFAYVPQGNFLLSGTIRENISFIKPEATDEEILDAAKISCALDFINELPDGMDTKIGEKGAGLSEGQVQRIAIARALLTGAPILLLDEATSALDSKTELQLLHNLKAQRNVTCILVSHKVAAEKVCNKKIIIKDKKIIVSEINNG